MRMKWRHVRGKLLSLIKSIRLIAFVSRYLIEGWGRRRGEESIKLSIVRFCSHLSVPLEGDENEFDVLDLLI